MPPADFPRLYDAHQRSFHDDLPFWMELARRRPGRLLELGCGTGRVLLPLARAGIDVDGIDQDPAMLARASFHLSREPGLPVRLHQADLRDFRLAGRYALIIVPCNTFAVLSGPEAAAALASIRRHLEPGGWFAAEVPDPEQGESLPADEPIDSFSDPESGRPVQAYAEQSWQLEPPRSTITWMYDELMPDGQVSRTRASWTLYLRTPETLSGMLSQSGFAASAYFGGYDLSPYACGSDRILVVAGDKPASLPRPKET